MTGRKRPSVRHCVRSEAIQLCAKKVGLLRRGACHRARIRATRWLLAMTTQAWPLPPSLTRLGILDVLDVEFSHRAGNDEVVVVQHQRTRDAVLEQFERHRVDRRLL